MNAKLELLHIANEIDKIARPRPSEWDRIRADLDNAQYGLGGAVLKLKENRAVDPALTRELQQMASRLEDLAAEIGMSIAAG
jgi:hypothetical protein